MISSFILPHFPSARNCPPRFSGKRRPALRVPARYRARRGRCPHRPGCAVFGLLFFRFFWVAPSGGLFFPLVRKEEEEKPFSLACSFFTVFLHEQKDGAPQGASPILTNLHAVNMRFFVAYAPQNDKWGGVKIAAENVKGRGPVLRVPQGRTASFYLAGAAAQSTFGRPAKPGSRSASVGI